MNSKYIYILLIIAFLLLYFALEKTPDYNNLLFNISLFFDEVKNSKKDFPKYKKIVDKIFDKMDYRNAIFFIIDKDNCLTYQDKVKVCKIGKKDCNKYENLWEQINLKHGQRLENNLLKTTIQGNPVIYKTYNSNAIGIEFA